MAIYIQLLVISIMSHTLFSQKEIKYLMSHRLARLATVSTSSSRENKFIQPDVVPVDLDFDGEFFFIGEMSILKSTKYKNTLKNKKVAIVIDDLGDVDPPFRQDGYTDRRGHLRHHYVRISPKKKWSWGIEEPMFVNGRFSIKKTAEKD
jgi:pyridoxamine 5'-phosphate oxidase family protein